MNLQVFFSSYWKTQCAETKSDETVFFLQIAYTFVTRPLYCLLDQLIDLEDVLRDALYNHCCKPQHLLTVCTDRCIISIMSEVINCRYHCYSLRMTTSCHERGFPIAVFLWRESIGYHWILLTKSHSGGAWISIWLWAWTICPINRRGPGSDVANLMASDALFWTHKSFACIS